MPGAPSLRSLQGWDATDLRRLGPSQFWLDEDGISHPISQKREIGWGTLRFGVCWESRLSRSRTVSKHKICYRPYRHRRRPPDQSIAIAPNKRDCAHDHDGNHGVDQSGASAGNYEGTRHVWLFAAQLPGCEDRHDRGRDPQPVVDADELDQRMQPQQSIHDRRT